MVGYLTDVTPRHGNLGFLVLKGLGFLDFERTPFLSVVIHDWKRRVGSYIVG